MRLEDIQLNRLGAFTTTECGFRVDRYHLEEPWGYIYTASQVLLRVDQRGPDYVQFAPPGGNVMLRRERYQLYPSSLVWIKTGKETAFTNFFRPTIGAFSTSAEPEIFRCEYSPEKALYLVGMDSILCETELFVSCYDPVLVMTCTINNMDSRPRELGLFPVVRPHMAATSLAAWDVPSLYQMVGYSNDDYHLFYLQLRSPAGNPAQREHAFVLSDIDSPDTAEVSYASFVGRGSFECPEALCGQGLSIPGSRRFPYGDYTEENSVNGEQGIVALHRNLRLNPGERFTFRMVMGSPCVGTRRDPPGFDEISVLTKYFGSDVREDAKSGYLCGIREMISARRIDTPDPAFNRYINEYLPLQLKWVGELDRGWPTGMRGTRDSAQDATAFIPLDPTVSRKRLMELFAVQRLDGWFPRQYSIQGKQGNHDLRGYVDGGVWVWELLYDYLCYTKDFDVLDEKVAWLDNDCSASLLEHALSLIDYYLSGCNIGEHGLCLIREGDWNDPINRAGLEGRGESVMVSCQVVFMLGQAAGLLEHLHGLAVPRSIEIRKDVETRVSELRGHSETLKANLLTHALNEEGYLNGVFTDNGEWVFSPSDPDGRRRVNIPVNCFGIISGVLTGDSASRVMDILANLKQVDGWPLFYPGIGDRPIAKLGRLGEGDLIVGLAENGTPYNHGSHGFFARAASQTGRGDLLLEILKYMLPYDQRRHPVERAKTAPYGVVNHWKSAPGLEGRGGDCFLSGSISTALRDVYDGLFGVRPLIDGLALNPALPSDWNECSVSFSYLGSDVKVVYKRRTGHGKLIGLMVNGIGISCGQANELNSEYRVIPDRVFRDNQQVEIIRHVRMIEERG